MLLLAAKGDARAATVLGLSWLDQRNGLPNYVAGLWLWTLVEYVLHRYVLHHMPYIKEMHQARHDKQDALLGTSIWMNLGSFAVLLVLPAWFVLGPTATAGLTAGMMLGYGRFQGIHHILHHWRITPGTYAHRLKRRHLLHHHFDNAGNFGVTNGFWDVVLGTDIRVRARNGDPSRT